MIFVVEGKAFKVAFDTPKERNYNQRKQKIQNCTKIKPDFKYFMICMRVSIINAHLFDKGYCGSFEFQ